MGSDVRVAVEDTGFKSYLEQDGKVKGSHGDIIEVCFNNFSVFGFAPVQIHSKLLEMVSLPLKPAVALKTMVRVSRAIKQAFLECAEVLELIVMLCRCLRSGHKHQTIRLASFVPLLCGVWS